VSAVAAVVGGLLVLQATEMRKTALRS
jgi:hypothetical protein